MKNMGCLATNTTRQVFPRTRIKRSWSSVLYLGFKSEYIVFYLKSGFKKILCSQMLVFTLILDSQKYFVHQWNKVIKILFVSNLPWLKYDLYDLFEIGSISWKLCHHKLKFSFEPFFIHQHACYSFGCWWYCYWWEWQCWWWWGGWGWRIPFF